MAYSILVPPARILAGQSGYIAQVT